MVKNKYVISLYGQSASGKTTLLNALNGKIINGMVVKTIPNIIRSIYAEESSKLMTPGDVMEQYNSYMESFDWYDIYAHELVQRYFLSQKWLQAKCHFKIRKIVNEDVGESCIYLTDRSPLDFYAYTVGALKMFDKNMTTPAKLTPSKVVDLSDLKYRTQNFINEIVDGMVIVKPHGKKIAEPITGARLMGMNDEYTGKNWYKHTQFLEKPKCEIIEPDIEVRISQMVKFLEDNCASK